MILFHVCNRSGLSRIVRDGLGAGTVWTPDRWLAECFVQIERDEGHGILVLATHLETLIELGEHLLQPDRPTPAVPDPTDPVGFSNDGLGRTILDWRLSLEAFRSVRFEGQIAPGLLTASSTPHVVEAIPLLDFAAKHKDEGNCP